MANDDIRKLIEAFNKAPLKNVPDPSREIDGLRRKLGRQPRAQTPNPQSQIPNPKYPIPQPLTPHPRDFGPPVTLDEVVSGVVTWAPAGPGYLHIEVPAHEIDSEAALIHRRFLPMTGHPDCDPVERLAQTCRSERIRPDQIVFIDLETTGLSMTPVFLIGTMECSVDGFTFHQYFARDYAEEASILSAFKERMPAKRLAITFNGKSFDLPYLMSRGIATGVTMPEPEFHLDLLHEARRLYGRDLPNCKLQTLEQHICGRERDDDIPGSEIPAAYHEFVRTGNANKIRSILAHNLQDILTMADLMCRMWRWE